MTTTTTERENKNKEKRIPKTVRPKNVVIDGKAYVKCPYPDCGYMVEDWGGFYRETGLRGAMLSDPKRNIYGHIGKVHKLVWLRKGKTAGWWSLSKFHPKSEEAGGRREEK